ncbi:YoaK family protein [Corynebacterium sp.]|uniref:YoaK family protein n=1 Tax=Corynebacterium sp. TaxID=1720 RepID=UPI0025BD4F69|nr:YoaK family protein [Corynebacterium sp.]
MHTYRRGERLLALSLAAVAGYADSIGFMFYGGVFLSFMSGNSTRLAVSVVEDDGDLMRLAGRCIVLFMVGVMCGALAHRIVTRRWDRFRAREAVLATVSVLFLVSSVALLSGSEILAVSVLSVGVGAMNSVFERDGEVSIALTYMTGTLVKAGQRFVDSFFGGQAAAWVYPLLMAMCLSAGAIVGAVVFFNFGLVAVYPLTALLVAVALVNQVVRGRRRRLGLPL